MSIIPFSNSRNLMASDAPLTMTSREIATLTGKEHKHVLRDIRVMLSDLELGESNFGLTYLDAQNRQQTEYALDESLSVTLVSGYDAKMRFAIVKRWRELENGFKVSPPAELTRLDILQLAIESEQGRLAAVQQVFALEVVVAEQAIKVDAHNLLADADGSMTVTEAAKNLQAKPMQLTKYLRDNKWIYKQGSSYLSFQVRLDAGLMMHKITLVEVCGAGETLQRYATQARVTAKGLAKISLVFAAK